MLWYPEHIKCCRGGAHEAEAARVMRMRQAARGGAHEAEAARGGAHEAEAARGGAHEAELYRGEPTRWRLFRVDPTRQRLRRVERTRQSLQGWSARGRVCTWVELTNQRCTGGAHEAEGAGVGLRKRTFMVGVHEANF